MRLLLVTAPHMDNRWAGIYSPQEAQMFPLQGSSLIISLWSNTNLILVTTLKCDQSALEAWPLQALPASVHFRLVLKGLWLYLEEMNGENRQEEITETLPVQLHPQLLKLMTIFITLLTNLNLKHITQDHLQQKIQTILPLTMYLQDYCAGVFRIYVDHLYQKALQSQKHHLLGF